MKPFSLRILGWALLVISLAVAAQSTHAQPAVNGQWTNDFTWGGGGGIEAVHTFLLPTGIPNSINI